MSSDSLQSSIFLLWLCSEELPKPYQHFQGMHSYKLLETVRLEESPKRVLTRKIWFYQWDSLDILQDIFYELLKCHQVRMIFFIYLCTVFISGWKDIFFTRHNSRNRTVLIKSDNKLNGLLWYDVLGYNIVWCYFLLWAWILWFYKCFDYIYFLCWCVWESSSWFFHSFSFKGYLCYKTNFYYKVVLDVQLMKFSIWSKNNVSFLRYLDFCAYVKSTEFKICDIIISIAA